MAQLRDIFEHERLIPLETQGALLGDTSIYLLGSGTASSISDLGSAFRPTDIPIDVDSVDELTLRLTDAVGDFTVPMFNWTSLDGADPGDTLSEAQGTGIRAYAAGSSSEWVLVGRTEGNQVLVQAGTYTHSSSVNVAVHTKQLLGGLLDFRLRASVGRRRVCMVARSPTRPETPGSAPHDNGRTLRQVTVSGVTWYQAGRAVPGGTAQLWLAFGESVYDSVRGQWAVQSTWLLVNTSNTAYAIEYGPAWTGPFVAETFSPAVHRYASLRTPDGHSIVRRIGNDRSSENRDWALLSETYVGGSNYRAEPYLKRTFFDFYPEDFRILRWEWEWDDLQTSEVNGVTYRDRVDRMVAATSVVASPEMVRNRAVWVPTRARGAVWSLRAVRNQELRAARTPLIATGGSSSADYKILVQFETDESTGALPIKFIRFVEIVNGGQNVRGWLRTWVL